MPRNCCGAAPRSGSLLAVARRHHRLVAPAGHVLDEVARREALGLALDHLADRAAVHRLAELERRDVAFHVVHPAAHVGVDRQPLVADADHAVAERRQRRSPSARNCRRSACRCGRLFRCQARAIVRSSCRASRIGARRARQERPGGEGDGTAGPGQPPLAEAQLSTALAVGALEAAIEDPRAHLALVLALEQRAAAAFVAPALAAPRRPSSRGSRGRPRPGRSSEQLSE